jgi:hypothetical protein
VKRAIVIALSVILALVVAAPIASGQSSSQGKNLGKGQNLGKLTGDWWNWAVSTNPSPLNEEGGDPCGGNFVDGVFFLAGSFAPDAVTRSCTVPANTPILFPVVNYACGAAPTIDPDGDGTFTGDPKPYSKCAQDPIDEIASNSKMIATLDGQPLEIQRLESGPFTLTNPSPRSEILPNAPPGSYKSWASGFWVYLPQGLEPRVEPYTLHWSVLPVSGEGFTQDITYNLTVVD